MKSWISICILIVISVPLSAQVKSSEPSTSTKVEDGPNGTTKLPLNGLDIECNSQGSWTKIYATYTQPVDVPDRQGIKDAQIIAEEKGKAKVVRFLTEKVTANLLIEEVDTTLKNSTYTTGSGSDHLSNTTQREIKKSIREFTHSYAQGTLRGVTILAEGYDSAKEEAWVKVGFSRATMAIADSVKRGMESAGSAEWEVVPDTATKGSSEPVKRQPNEVRSRPDLP